MKKTTLPIGPFHPLLEEPEFFTLTVEGEKVVGIDACIQPIVAALNSANIATVASCCGHGKEDGSIVLADGRELRIIAAGRPGADISCPVEGQAGGNDEEHQAG